jgi:hypothetical protein
MNNGYFDFSAMVERNKQVRIFGPELCAEEAIAVFGMVRMSLYENQISSEFRTDTMLFERDSDKSNSALNQSPTSPPSPPSSPVTTQVRADSDDIRLPPFVREVLEHMRDSKTLEEFNEVVGQLVTLVPSESERRAYVRVYKWVVAFATWRYTKTPEEELMHQKHMKLVELHEQRAADQQQINSSTLTLISRDLTESNL